MMKDPIFKIWLMVFFISCVPWDYKMEPRWDVDNYKGLTTFYDRAVRRQGLLYKGQTLAGASRKDITPYKKKGVFMAGFNADRRSTGVLDPIYVRCAYISNGEEQITFITLDLIGYFYDDIEVVREMISRDERLNKRIIISSTHNHEGPDTMGLWGAAFLGILPIKNGRDPEYDRWLKERIVKCANEAVDSARPAVVRFAKIDVPEGYQENLRKEGYKENTMYLMRADGIEGRSIFTIANYPIHIEALGEENHLISADILGAMYSFYEENQDGVLLFTQGSLGGMIVPRISKWASPIEKRRFRDVVGRELAIMALKGLEENSILEKDPLVIEHRYKRIALAVENPDFELAHKLHILDRKIEKGLLETEIHYIKIGSGLFVTIPGESLPELGFEINRLMPSEYKFKINLGMDEIGYILPESYFGDPLYEYERSMSLGPKTAGVIYNTIKELIQGGR